MGLFTDTVPRELYDALQTRYDALLDKYHSLRMQGQAPTKPAVLIPPKPDSGQLAVLSAERVIRTPGAQAIVEELMQKGKSEADALRIVAEMQNVGRGKALPEPGGP
jgi:hypothetical protein